MHEMLEKDQKIINLMREVRQREIEVQECRNSSFAGEQSLRVARVERDSLAALDRSLLSKQRSVTPTPDAGCNAAGNAGCFSAYEHATTVRNAPHHPAQGHTMASTCRASQEGGFASGMLQSLMQAPTRSVSPIS